MEKVITYSFGEDFIDNLAHFLCNNFLKKNNDLSRVACVFGGKRPALFLKRQISRTIKKSYIPPRMFSMDDFIDYLIPENNRKINNLDACFLVYELVKKHIPAMLEGRKSFSSFLGWAKEIVSFIEQLDLEDIRNDCLVSVEKSASIGYEIPASINRLLMKVITLREAYHKALGEKDICSRGAKYLHASEAVFDKDFDEFDIILFCNFFYLHKTERKIIKSIYDKNKAICIFQGSDDDWSVLKKSSQTLDFPIKPKEYSDKFNLSLYQGFDMHSQSCIVRDILKKEVKDKNNTVVVVPRQQAVVPLLHEVSSVLDEFNISMGYPLALSSLYVLFDFLLKAQGSKKADKYYTKDYLNVIQHPLVKNLKIGKKAAITRVLVHKLEELSQGVEQTSIEGSLFLKLSEIEREERIYLRSSQTLQAMKLEVSPDECKDILGRLNTLLFRRWEGLADFRGLADAMEELLRVLADKGALLQFPFNIKVAEKMHTIKEEFRSLLFKEEKFSPAEIWEILRQKLQSEKVSFIGSPLRGTQILGLFETRSLNFENVIVMDLNEAVLPRLKVYEPLIPREVMLSLGLNRLEKEEEIQRYQFMRLISGAKNVYLVYEENQEKEKSRFIEELLWKRQKQSGKLEILSIPRARFAFRGSYKSIRVNKTRPMLESLKKATYSASRLGTYLRCPLQFYYQYILGLRERENLLEDPQASHIGTFIHELLEQTFRKFVNREPVIDTKFRKYFSKKMDEKFEKEFMPRMRSDSFLLKKIIENRMNKFLDNEIKRKVSKIICLEEGRVGVIKLNNKSMQFKYTVDRIDELDDRSIVIIDYKTGGASIVPKRFSSLQAVEMNRESIKSNIRSFQLPIYQYLISKEYPGCFVSAEIYNLRVCKRTSFIGEADLEHTDKIMEICLKSMESIFEELFDPDIPFAADKEERKCRFCPFTLLCR